MRNEKEITINHVGIMHDANNAADERVSNKRDT